MTSFSRYNYTMKYETEIVQEKQKALIVSEHNYNFIGLLKSKLKNNSVEPFFSSIRPKSITRFDYCFFITKKNKDVRIEAHNRDTVKTVDVAGSSLSDTELDKILWFSFSSGKERYLKINYLTKKETVSTIKKVGPIKPHLTRNNLIMFIFSLIVFIHLIFAPFGLVSSFYIYRSLDNLRKENIENSEYFVSKASLFNNISKKLYSLSRPTFQTLGISAFPDDFVEINNHSIDAILQSQVIVANSKEIQRQIFKKNKSAAEKDDLKLRFKKLDSSLEQLAEDMASISQKLDLPFEKVKSLKKKLFEASDLISKSRRFMDYFEKAISSETPKNYLIFFANNMELRPGGGFIGSFAVVKLEDYEVGELRVYDVYDADGQLTAHVDPPKAISKYLGVPHWFLRDSNFSPDFPTNYQKALFFLEKELGMSNFDGSVLITTTSVENILSAFDNLYLPDYRETINAKNFYLKTQFQVEKNFFPGSTQKQTFLSSIVQQMIINLENVSTTKLLLGIKKSLDEKQMVVYSSDKNIQALVDSSFWSGRVIEPKCLMDSEECIIDYLFPYDANVGANKANFFINKSIYLKTLIDNDGKINHQLLVKYENSSPSEIFPTGYFRNYFQTLLSKNSIIKSVTVNGVSVDDYDESNDNFKSIGFFFEIPPKGSAEIKINYVLDKAIGKGKQIYQLTFQKQIGAGNSDLILDFRLGNNISLKNQNFSPLVKDGAIIYNTNLSTDKIFFIELSNL